MNRFDAYFIIPVDNTRRESQDQHQTHVHLEDECHDCSSHAGSCKDLHLLKHDKEGFVQIDIYNAYIEKAIENGKCLIVGFDGVSNSASVLAAYLMWKRKLTVHDALDLIKKARPIVKIPRFLYRDLENYEIRLASDNLTTRVIPRRKK